jgi:hypothetical protein
MSLAKTTEIDKVEVVGQYKTVQVRTATIITEDGVELSRGNHRHVLQPGHLGVGSTLVDTDISSEDPSVQAVCNAVWTDAIKESYRQFLVEIKSS